MKKIISILLIFASVPVHAQQSQMSHMVNGVTVYYSKTDSAAIQSEWAANAAASQQQQEENQIESELTIRYSKWNDALIFIRTEIGDANFKTFTQDVRNQAIDYQNQVGIPFIGSTLHTWITVTFLTKTYYSTARRDQLIQLLNI